MTKNLMPFATVALVLAAVAVTTILVNAHLAGFCSNPIGNC